MDLQVSQKRKRLFFLYWVILSPLSAIPRVGLSLNSLSCSIDLAGIFYVNSSLTWLPGSSAGKESAFNAGGPCLIPGSGRSPGEGIGYPLQYSWASLVAQLVKNLPAMQETWVQSLGWEDPLEKGKATHSSILAWRIPWTVWSTGLQRVGHAWLGQSGTSVAPE